MFQSNSALHIQLELLTCNIKQFALAAATVKFTRSLNPLSAATQYADGLVWQSPAGLIVYK